MPASNVFSFPFAGISGCKQIRFAVAIIKEIKSDFYLLHALCICWPIFTGASTNCINKLNFVNARALDLVFVFRPAKYTPKQKVIKSKTFLYIFIGK